MNAELRKVVLGISVATAMLLGGGSLAQASAIHDAGLFTTGFPGNDDGSVGPVGMGFSANFFGNTYSSLYVNNNGNVTFDGPMWTYTPFSLLSTATPVIAPFFADVDTRDAIPDVTYGTGTLGGRNVFGVNWIDVGYYYIHPIPTNSFQLILTDRSDIAPGDFDIQFNYDQILWETGDASSGSGGLGGYSARAGWSNGVAASYEIAGSAVNGALLDGNTITGLINNSLNSSILGQYNFFVRNGIVQPVPEPTSLALLGLGLAGLAFAKRRKQIAA